MDVLPNVLYFLMWVQQTVRADGANLIKHTWGVFRKKHIQKNNWDQNGALGAPF